jgi:hypothetical protein
VQASKLSKAEMMVMSRTKELPREGHGKKHTPQQFENERLLPSVETIDMPGWEDQPAEPVGDRGKAIVSIHGRDVDDHEIKGKEKAAA